MLPEPGVSNFSITLPIPDQPNNATYQNAIGQNASAIFTFSLTGPAPPPPNRRSPQHGLSRRDPDPNTPAAPGFGCEIYALVDNMTIFNINITDVPDTPTNYTTDSYTPTPGSVITFEELCAADATPVAITIANIMQTIFPPPEASSSASTSMSDPTISISGGVSVTTGKCYLFRINLSRLIAF